MELIYREALLADIPQIQVVRNAVKENTLSDPALVSDADCADFIGRRGRGWVCLADGELVGFSIVDLQENNVWALFLLPDYEGLGIGKQLHRLMLDWYFAKTRQTIWLGTSPGTRAEKFYRKAGWRPAGMHGSDELKFEMDYEDWQRAGQAVR
jgi:GNAT superfamily N-acetyltransferase